MSDTHKHSRLTAIKKRELSKSGEGPPPKKLKGKSTGKRHSRLTVIEKLKTISGKKLPSKKDVLGKLLYEHCEKRKTVKESALIVVGEVIQFWDKARIPTRDKSDCVKKVKKLYNEYLLLRKNKYKQSEFLRAKIESFSKELPALFDISHANALNIIEIEEDKEFLRAQQRTGRKGHMGSVDKVLAKKEQALSAKVVSREAKKHHEQLRAQLERQKLEKVWRTANLSSSASSDETSSESSAAGQQKMNARRGRKLKKSSHPEFPSPSVIPPLRQRGRGRPKGDEPPSSRKRGRVAIISVDLAAALDRENVSNRTATRIAAQTAKTLGHDVRTLALNEKSVRKSREKHRKMSAEKVKEAFNPKSPLVVHWDGKLLPELTGRQKVDRLPILVSGFDIEDQLLSVPALPSGTGEAQAKSIYEALADWKVVNLVRGMCFDTTSSNTGVHKGACTCLESLLDKPLLHFACRHHIPELILESAVTVCFGKRKQPEIPEFTKFRDVHWDKIDKTKFTTATQDKYVSKLVKPDKDEIIHFAMDLLRSTQPRDDYQELLELTIIFLGGSPKRGIRFRAPGPISKARWMAAAIYALKIWLFQDQVFAKDDPFLKNLTELCLFLVKVYVQYWFKAPLATQAPNNDLMLLKKLSSYSAINSEISKSALDKLLRHLWYLSEELVSLAFFDLTVPINVEKKMVLALKKSKSKERPPKIAELDLKMVKNIKKLDLSAFVTKHSMNFFSWLKISSQFLTESPAKWPTNRSFVASRNLLKKLRVVNDNAERAVALIQSYNSTITKKEDQKQFLLQVVAEHRKKFPTTAKKFLI